MAKHKTKKGMSSIAAICASVASLCVFASGAHVAAAEDPSVPVYLTQEATGIDVTVTDKAIFDIPKENSNKATVSNLVVKNNLESAHIEVSNIRASAEDGYNLEAFDTDFSQFNSDSKHFGIAYTVDNPDGEDISGEGLDIEKVILGQGEKRFKFKGLSSVYSNPILLSDNIHMANIVFTIGFADSDFVPETARGDSDELEKWDYTLNDDEGTVTLNYYLGAKSGKSYVADEDVIVYGSYEIGDKVYRTLLAGNPSTSLNQPYMFNARVMPQNASIKSITFDEDVDSRSASSMRGMFALDTSLESLDLGSIDTSNVTDMYAMFYGNSALTSLDLSSFDTSNVTDMMAMFSESALTSLDLTSFDTSNVTTMRQMFSSAENLTSLDLSSFDTSNVTGMGMCNMFFRASSLSSLDLSSFDTSNVTNMSGMFAGTYSLEELNLSSFDTSNVTSMTQMFQGAENLTSLDVSSFNTGSVTDMSYMFNSLFSLTSLDLSSFDTSNVTDMMSMFSGDESLTSLDLSSFNTSNVTNMAYMFNGASSLTSLDLSSFDTSSVVYMNDMFRVATSLTSLDTTGWDTSSVTTMASMFSGNSYVGDMKLMEIKGLENWNTSKVADMTAMFYGMGAMENYDIANWDVSNVEGMNHMFCDNFKLKTLDLSKWNVSKVKTMYDMFDDNRSLATIGDVSKWNTASLIDAGGWLNGASLFAGNNGTLDLSGWNTSNLKVTGEMFRGVKKLETIDLSGWSFESLTDSTWPGADDGGIYYETGNSHPAYKGAGGMFLNASNLTTVYVSEGASIPNGVNTTDMWTGTKTTGFTVK